MHRNYSRSYSDNLEVKRDLHYLPVEQVQYNEKNNITVLFKRKGGEGRKEERGGREGRRGEEGREERNSLE